MDGQIGRTIRIGGWVKTGREAGAGAFAFLEVNDGSAFESLQVNLPSHFIFHPIRTNLLLCTRTIEGDADKGGSGGHWYDPQQACSNRHQRVGGGRAGGDPRGDKAGLCAIQRFIGGMFTM